MRTSLIELAYLVAAVLFIVGLRGLTHPRTAVRGNRIAALGMLVAVVAVLIDRQIVSYGALAAGVAIGGVIGAISARRIEMTAMPQLVAVFNGLGGVASALVAAAQYVIIAGALRATPLAEHAATSVAIAGAALVGAVTFTGSVVAFAKLQGLVGGGAVRIPGGRALSAALLAAALAVAVAMVVSPSVPLLWVLAALAAVLGVTLVVPIGGADMPVVISLLNSYSGLAAAAAGFALGNIALIISGSLVGASGIILTQVMCRAMNRSLANVLFGGSGAAAVASADDPYAGKIKSTSADEVAMLLETAGRVVFVPGYGMAVAQAQHVVSELARALRERGAEVEFAIHPVAGRMPGHMNVLLAEADVSYDHLREMEDINPTFPQVDVAVVIGANDVVNPAARTDARSPIAGMPILDVYRARTVVVIKRSLSPGFTGIANPLFCADNALMLFSDCKRGVQEIATALAESGPATGQRLAG